MSKKVEYQLLRDLSERKRGHLAWRLDHKTGIGMITANNIARCEPNTQWYDMTIYQIFREIAELSDHASKIHSRKVVNFELSKAEEAWMTNSSRVIQEVIQSLDSSKDSYFKDVDKEIERRRQEFYKQAEFEF